MAKKSKKTKRTDKLNHSLIPRHRKLSDKEKKALFDNYKVSLQELPKISSDDPAIRHLDVKEGDIIMIERESPITGRSVYYRGVIDA